MKQTVCCKIEENYQKKKKKFSEVKILENKLQSKTDEIVVIGLEEKEREKTLETWVAFLASTEAIRSNREVKAWSESTTITNRERKASPEEAATRNNRERKQKDWPLKKLEQKLPKLPRKGNQFLLHAFNAKKKNCTLLLLYWICLIILSHHDHHQFNYYLRFQKLITHVCSSFLRRKVIYDETVRGDTRVAS